MVKTSIKSCYLSREFFEDISSEANKCGGLLEVRVARNSCVHLRGNVYLHYECTADAVAAHRAIQGRYYGGRVVSCVFVAVRKFKNALCGESII